MSEFRKDEFRKSEPAPVCSVCRARTRDRDETGLHWMCHVCKHVVDSKGVCMSSHRCISCEGLPRCQTCRRIAQHSGKNEFSCLSCGHSIDQNGCCTDQPCLTCHPHQCGSCERDLEGELDDEGEIFCAHCDHFVDSEGSCVTSRRGHCYTCDGDYPQCPACDSTTSENGYVDDEEDYLKRYSCDAGCYHEIDDDGDCLTGYCNACSPIECSTCGRFISDESDSDGEVWCNDCEHHVDSDGDCATTDCSTCEPSSYTCNQCGETVYGELDDDGEIKCETCDHYIDSDGDCATTDCSTCGGENEQGNEEDEGEDEPDGKCGECGKVTCKHGIYCEFVINDNCWFCHCRELQDSTLLDEWDVNCPNCEDSQFIEISWQWVSAYREANIDLPRDEIAFSCTSCDIHF